MSEPIRVRFEWASDEPVAVGQRYALILMGGDTRWQARVWRTAALTVAAGLVLQRQGLEHWPWVLLCLVPLLVLSLGPWPGYWVGRLLGGRRKRGGGQEGEVREEWSFTPGGIEFAMSYRSYAGGMKRQPRWEDVTECIRTPDGFFLVFRVHSGLGWKWLPDRGFAGPEARTAFAELAQAKVRKYRTADYPAEGGAAPDRPRE